MKDSMRLICRWVQFQAHGRSRMGKYHHEKHERSSLYFTLKETSFKGARSSRTCQGFKLEPLRYETNALSPELFFPVSYKFVRGAHKNMTRSFILEKEYFPRSLFPFCTNKSYYLVKTSRFSNVGYTGMCHRPGSIFHFQKSRTGPDFGTFFQNRP